MLAGTRLRTLMLIGVASIALAACGDKKGDGDKPAGQVVASVNGEEITIHELNAEIAGSPFPPNTPRKAAEQQALQSIITRRLLMDVAKEKKLDQNPDFLMQQRRANEQLLVQSYLRTITQGIPPVTREEAEKFMRDYPNLFSERKFFILDQIQFLRPKNIDQLPLAGAKTMADVERVLINANVEYRRQPASLDALSANPDFINEVVKVVQKNPDEVFMFANQPQGAPAPVVLINKVTELRTIPFTGERAMAFAQNFLMQIKVNGTLQQQVGQLRDKAKDKITYQAGYAPPAAAKPAGPAQRPKPSEVADEAAKDGQDRLATPTEKASQNIVPKS
ncbi:hypothetical protein [Sandaracinobacteroides saxicola]|uniref:Peptidyl-prolyl cis-trans isomerase, EpsD family n=1 Tax=Sandaracinobacteroides saxicola TaxID=2759707 RepID=A0A7G5IFC9_9SPHN|nr:hypothetical protein [Sandaracinobacteroides saxicola]QMW22071.1 hypothetical protein H3309_11925 [Sandaracinobacteroides saxicola]